MSKVNKEALKSGKVLRYLRNAFLNDQTVMNLSPLFDCLIDSDLYVPMNVIMSNEDINTFKNSNVGDVVSLNNNIRMKPDWLKINDESEEEEERRKRIAAEQNGSDIGTLLGLTVGLIADAISKEENIEYEDEETRFNLNM